MEEKINERGDRGPDVAAVNKFVTMWDESILPDPPAGFVYEEAPGLCKQYINKLKNTLMEVAGMANENEYLAQQLADHNIRQTKLLQRLRARLAELHRERTK